MSVNNLSRRDSLKCTVSGHNADGCFLKIIGIEKEERPLVRLFDMILPYGTIVYASIIKISEDRKYIKMQMDSIEYDENQNYAA